jgi:hypothetical protein
MANDDVLPSKFPICNTIEVRLKTTAKTYVQIYVETEKSRHAIEWQIVQRSEAIVENIEFDQRRRVVPIAIQRWSKLIEIELSKSKVRGFNKTTVAPQPNAHVQ